MKEKINKTLFKTAKAIDRSRILLMVKIIIFSCLLFTALAMYQVRNIYLANDIIMMAVIFIMLNKMDKV